MSGSRFAAGLQGFNTGLFPGLYPTRPALGLPTAPTPSTPVAPPAPAMPGAPAPVSVGSQPMMPGASGPAMDTAQGGSPTDLGPNPGMIEGNLSGLGGWGTVGGALGTLAGMALGAPGLGLAAGALGTGFDVQQANAGLREAGRPANVSFGPAFANNMSFGLLGTSIPQQVAAAGGADQGGWDGAGFGANAQEAGEMIAAGPGVGYGGSLMGLSSMDDMAAPQVSFDFNSWGGTGDTAQGPSTAGHESTPGIGTDPMGGAFRNGGFTGDDGDGHYGVAGVVHEGEVVLRPEAVQHYGLGPLLALNRMEVPRSRLTALMGSKAR